MKRKLHTAAFALCCFLAISASSQSTASYILAGGAVTNESGHVYGLATNTKEANMGMAGTLETGILFGKNSVGLQYLARASGYFISDFYMMQSVSLVYGRELLPGRKISLSLHGGLGAEQKGVLFSSNEERKVSLLAPVYADVRFCLSKNRNGQSSFWLGFRGGRYFSTVHSYTLFQMNAAVVIPW